MNLQQRLKQMRLVNLQQRLKQIILGNIPNRLTKDEIWTGIFEITITGISETTKEGLHFITEQTVLDFVPLVSKYSMVHRHYWVHVLLFLPLNEIPPLLNNPNAYVQSACAFRLKVGK